MALFSLSKYEKKEERQMKKGRANDYATNKGGYIKAPRPVTKGEPKPTVERGNDLRIGKK